MMAQISVVMPIHQKEDTLLRVLEALAKQEDPGALELVLVFDACTDRSRQVAEASGVMQLFQTQILSVAERNPARVRNLGAEAAKNDHLLFLDADVILPSQHIGTLRHHIDTRGDSVLLTPVACNAVSADILPLLAPLPQNWHALDNDGLLAWSQAWPELGDLRLTLAGDEGDLDHLPYPWVLGWSTALCLPRGLFSSCSGFDDRYAGKGSEDLVLCRRLWQAGMRFRLLVEAPALHLPHARNRQAEVALDRQHEALLLSNAPAPDVELLCAFDGGHANAMADFLQRVVDRPARTRLESAFQRPLPFDLWGINAPVDLTVGLPPAAVREGAAQRAWPFAEDQYEATRDLPLFGFALPFAERSLETVVVGGLFEMLPQRLRLRLLGEAQRIASRVILVRLNVPLPMAQDLDGMAATLDAPYWETYVPLCRDPWLYQTALIGHAGPYGSYSITPQGSPDGESRAGTTETR